MGVPFNGGAIPSSVRILGKEYRVLVKKPRGNNLGLFNGSAQTITISPNHETMDEAADTLLHEIIHAIEYNCNMEVLEDRVRAEATQLLAIIRDNPDVVSLLTGDYKNVGRKRTPDGTSGGAKGPRSPSAKA